MKVSHLSKVLGASVLAASLAVVPLTVPAHAQNNGPDTSTQQNGDVNAQGPISQHTERDNDDLGWIGLLGLVGLAGLAGKKRRETVHTERFNNDPNVVARSGSDYR